MYSRGIHVIHGTADTSSLIHLLWTDSPSIETYSNSLYRDISFLKPAATNAVLFLKVFGSKSKLFALNYYLTWRGFSLLVAGNQLGMFHYFFVKQANETKSTERERERERERETKVPSMSLFANAGRVKGLRLQPNARLVMSGCKFAICNALLKFKYLSPWKYFKVSRVRWSYSCKYKVGKRIIFSTEELRMRNCDSENHLVWINIWDQS